MVIIDPVALDLKTQLAISNWLGVSAVDPSGSVGCILIVRASLTSLVASRRIHESLARRFDAAETQIPKLADRGDDLRALVLGKVARLGMSVYGEPRAVNTAVLAELLDYAWPGNELELDCILQLLVQNAVSPLITLEDLEQINFHKWPFVDQSGTPVPTVSGHRPPNRVIGQRQR